jgi:hypothetical protein
VSTKSENVFRRDISNRTFRIYITRYRVVVGHARTPCHMFYIWTVNRTIMDNKTTNHIADIFFYEELSELIGCNASFEWLQTSCAKKFMFSSPSLSSQASAATTPRLVSLVEICPPYLCTDQRDTSNNQQARSQKSDVPEPDTHTRQRLTHKGTLKQITPRQTCDLHEAYHHIEQQSRHLLRNDIDPHAAESAMGRIGLLYTDAAHSVLEDREVAQYIEHYIGCPLR